MGCSSPHIFLHCFKPPCSLETCCPADFPAWVRVPSPLTTSSSQATASFNIKTPVGAIHMSHSMSLLLCALESLLPQPSPELP